jgi:GTP-binding protein
LIFFTVSETWKLVDMPGYGYAAAPKAKVAAWTGLIQAYLRGRANLARVYVLIDARHGIKSADAPVFDLLDEAAVSYQILLTKADEVGAGALTDCMAATASTLAKRKAAYPEVLATSSRTGFGLPEMRAAMARVVTERGMRN